MKRLYSFIKPGIFWTLTVVTSITGASIAGRFVFEHTDALPDRLTRSAHTLQDADTDLLFDRLLVAKLIKFDSRKSALFVAPPDLVLRQHANDPTAVNDWPNIADSPQTRDLLSEMYADVRGQIIRAEIESWNGGAAQAAIRDNVPQKDKRQTQTIVQGDKHRSQWKVEVYDQQYSSIMVETPPERLGTKVPYDQYSQFSRGDAPPTNGWLTVRSSNTDRQRVAFTTEVVAPYDGFEMVVDVLGANLRSSGPSAQKIPLCEATESRCDSINRVRFTLPHGGQKYLPRFDVDMAALPSGNLIQRLRDYGKPIPIAPTACQVRHLTQRSRDECHFTDMATMALGASIRLHCSNDEKNRLCTLSWTRIEGNSPLRPDGQPSPPPVQPVVTDRNNIVLADAGAKEDVIPRKTLEMGLVPVVGVSPDDQTGLLGLAATLPSPKRRLALSLDAHLQELAQEALEENLPKSTGARAGLNNSARQAVLVVIDATDPSTSASSGEILAAATWPNVNMGEQDWNLLAERYDRPSKSSINTRAWSRHVNSFFAPGSTFKAMTALALIRHAVATGDPELIAHIAGRSKPPSFIIPPVNAPPNKLDFGLKLPEGVSLRLWTEHNSKQKKDEQEEGVFVPTGKNNNGDWVGKPIRNFSGEIADYAYLSAKVSDCPPLPNGAERQLGLCEATITSVNSWFIASALGLDLQTPIGGSAVSPDSPLLAMIQHFNNGDDESQPLKGSLLPDHPVSGDHRAYWLPFVTDLERLNGVEHRMLTLAYTSIGQTVQATPLGIANLYASVATGCRMRPRLDLGTRAPGCTGLFFADDTRNGKALEIMRTYFHPGLKGVVSAPKGTALKTLGKNQLKERIYAKTGTAEAPGDTITGWLAGWVEPSANTSATKRLAFACMVSHGTNKATGANLCGAMVSNFLSRAYNSPKAN